VVVVVRLAAAEAVAEVLVGRQVAAENGRSGCWTSRAGVVDC